MRSRLRWPVLLAAAALLVAAWNKKNPNCKVKLTYIPHTEMVGKIAQGIASGEVPDLMGMDLIYAPQFEKASSWSTSPTGSAAGRS